MRKREAFSSSDGKLPEHEKPPGFERLDAIGVESLADLVGRDLKSGEFSDSRKQLYIFFPI
ncbi:hypothetical protein [Methanoculleus oceani]|uniref:hypothetical protein n=1 Tax=Methanoculleus oceani TaxID=2184756 RepID=UPI00203495E6|nr:hypothetical protein [Methanoculleus sp. CWC-02]